MGSIDTSPLAKGEGLTNFLKKIKCQIVAFQILPLCCRRESQTPLNSCETNLTGQEGRATVRN